MFLLAFALAAVAALWYWRAGALLDYGDAMAHLNIARRIVDTRTPGMLQVGTVWLPLPHLLMAPLAADDKLWRGGLPGAAVGVPALALAALAMFLLLRDVTGRWPAAIAAGLLAANPNLLYLAATPMTEVVSLSATLWAFYFALHARRPMLAGILVTLACLTRYETWFLVPVIALVIGRRQGWLKMALFAVSAATGPAWWLAHNWWFFGDALEFYRGEFSTRAIYARQLASGVPKYPAEGDWGLAVQYYVRAVWLVAGSWLCLAGLAGWFAAARKQKWLLLLLGAPFLFFVWSLHSAGVQIYVPGLWPETLMNTRYALVMLPLLCAGAGLLAALHRWWLLAIAAIAIAPWLSPAVVRDEALRLSVERRKWTPEIGAFLAANYRGGGIALSFGDLTGALQQEGIPLRETLHDGDRLGWITALARPDLFLNEQWVLCFENDALSNAARRSNRYGLVRRFQRAEVWLRD